MRENADAYPCSYMIYSSQFDQLPATAKTAIYDRLWTEDRAAIVDILRDTKPDLPNAFSNAAH